MKTKITLFLVLLICNIGVAQNGINYKAVIKDNLGNVVANDPVIVQFSVLQGAALTNVYTETHNTTTDDNGIVILNIGEGTFISGNFANIDWASDDHFLNVRVDTGSGLINMGTTQFKSVPYAMAAGDIELPYFGSVNQSGAAFHVHNDSESSRFGLAGSVGVGGEILPANNAGVMGNGVGAHGVYGVSKTSFFAGVQGVSESATGVGVIGYGFGGGVGGHFYTTSTGTAALTTGTGNVGIGTGTPESKLHVAGDIFLASNLGGFNIGYPNNGNQWRLSTLGGGSTLVFRSKPDASTTISTRFMMEQTGEFKFGNITTGEDAWVHIKNNSSVNKQHLLLEEEGNDYARIGFKNTSSTGNWDIAALPSNVTTSARLNFYFRNASGAADRMVITGDGKVGINGTPTSRVHIYQAGQTVGTGLAFKDGTANLDWNITHGYALRFHYGATLMGTISATTGAYVQSSDMSLKSNIQNIDTILDRVKLLRPTSYFYKDDTSKKKSLGFIAQEVQSIFPEVVHYSEADNLYGIDYSGFGVVAIKAIQEQQTIIENQQKQIDELKAMVQSLLDKQ